MIQRSNATGAAAIALNVSIDDHISIDRVELHLSAVGTSVENLTISLDSGLGAAYDVNYLTQAMAAVQDLVYQPTRPLELVPGDVLKIAYANTSTRTYGITVYYRNS